MGSGKKEGKVNQDMENKSKYPKFYQNAYEETMHNIISAGVQPLLEFTYAERDSEAGSLVNRGSFNMTPLRVCLILELQINQQVKHFPISY